MVTTGLIVRYEAKPGKEQDVTTFLADALPLKPPEIEQVDVLAAKLNSDPRR